MLFAYLPMAGRMVLMQAVILAAGRGTRMGELTSGTPKPLLEVHGKPLFQFELESLPDIIDEVIVIVGYLGGAIQQRFGDSFGNRKIRYVEQGVLDGTAGALWRAKDVLKRRFLVLMADDIYSRDDAARCIEREDWIMLVKKTEHMITGGNVVTDAEGRILEIEEGRHGGMPGTINTNLFALDTRLFDYPMVPKSEGSDEFGLPQTILAAAKTSGIPFATEQASQWIQITSPEDLAKAEAILAQN